MPGDVCNCHTRGAQVSSQGQVSQASTTPCRAQGGLTEALALAALSRQRPVLSGVQPASPPISQFIATERRAPVTQYPVAQVHLVIVYLSFSSLRDGQVFCICLVCPTEHWGGRGQGNTHGAREHRKGPVLTSFSDVLFSCVNLEMHVGVTTWK